MMDTVLEQHVIGTRAQLSVRLALIKRGLKRIFDCWHREMTLPVTRANETYRTCINCGARRRFDLEQWAMVGEFYRPNLSTARESY